MRAEWRVFCEKISRSEIVYFVQFFMCVAIISTCVVMLALHDPNSEYWMVVLNSKVGYTMHSPNSQKKSSRKNRKSYYYSSP